MAERRLAVAPAVGYLEEVLSVDWLKENLKLLKDYGGGGGGFGRGIELASSGVATAAFYWYKAREELALEAISGQGPGIYALQAAVIGADLLALQGSPGLAARVQTLQQPANTDAVLAELAIAAGYAGRGEQVVFAGSDGIFQVAGREPIYAAVIYGEQCRPEQPGKATVIYRQVQAPGCTPGGTFDICLDSDGYGARSGAELGPAAGAATRIVKEAPAKGPEETLEPRTSNFEPRVKVPAIPVVHCRFIARQGRRGPEVIRTGWLDRERDGLPAAVYIPDEIIKPDR